MASLSIDKLQEIVFEKLLGEDEYNVFVETGTCAGETILAVQPYFETLYTVEIMERDYLFFDQKKNDLQIDNIKNYLGDSSKVLPEILNVLSEKDNCIFWLDGHWSSGDTGRGEKDCPLIEECLSIDELYKSEKAIILIDDHSLFGTHINEDWSEITDENILKCFNNFNITKKFIHNNIFCIMIEKSQ